MHTMRSDNHELLVCVYVIDMLHAQRGPILCVKNIFVAPLMALSSHCIVFLHRNCMRPMNVLALTLTPTIPKPMTYITLDTLNTHHILHIHTCSMLQ